MYMSAPKNSGFPSDAPSRAAISLAAALLRPGSSHAATARPSNISRKRSPQTAVSMLPPCLCLFPAGPVRQPFQQSGAPGYLLFLTEQAATPVIHAGSNQGTLRCSGGGDRGCQERAQRLRNSAERSGRIEPQLNTLLL